MSGDERAKRSQAPDIAGEGNVCDPASARAKHLPLVAPTSREELIAREQRTARKPQVEAEGDSGVELPELVPARMINEVLYCERLMYLEWVQGEWADNVFTVDGQVVHRRVNAGGRPLRKGGKLKGQSGAPEGKQGPRSENAAARGESTETGGANDSNEPGEDRPYQARSVWLSSEKLGITAKIDLVDVEEASVVPVEYKRGAKPNVPSGAYLPELAQVCAQVLLLREHGYHCQYGEIYYAKDRTRVPISITPSLIADTLWAVERVRELARRGELPPPLVDSPKCLGCSLVSICLPDETQALRAPLPGDAEQVPPEPSDDEDCAEPPEFQGLREADPWGFRDPTSTSKATTSPAATSSATTNIATTEGRTLSTLSRVRRLFPARDDKLPVYVQDHGAFVRLEGERLIVQRRDQPAVEARLTNTSHVALFGGAQITTPAIRTLMERGIPLLFFTSGGWFSGQAIGHDSKNVELRLAQFAATRDKERCLKLARGFVASKILNCRTLLRRNHSNPSEVALFELKQLARKARQAQELESLLGIEGTAARVYFSEFSGMIKAGEGELETFDLSSRNRRPPRDPVNALLSFTYSLLTKELTLAARAAGLDPLLGFYHQPHFGRPSLALDLMEEFRPVIADSVVITAINNRVITSTDFVRAAGSVALTTAARKRLIQAFERRMDQLVIHPIFDYRISYRRVLEVQARLLSRLLLGEIPAYPEFRVR